MGYIGVDLHTNKFTAAYRTSERLKWVCSFNLDLMGISNFRKKICKKDLLAVEITGNTRYFVEQIADAVKDVVVVNTKQFEIIKRSSNKTDKNDSKLLALFLSKDLLPSVRMKSKEQSQLSSLINTRGKLVQLRTVLKNKIHGILNSYGIKLKRESLGSVKGLESVFDYNLDSTVVFELEVIVGQIKSLNDSIAKLENRIKEQAQSLKGYENLTSIKGIGSLSASILLTVIGDINDFADNDKLASYFGIVPRVSSSNETVHHGRITRAGSKLGRTTLVQCTLVAKRYSPYLQEYYERIRVRRGSGRAIIATARKLLSIIYRTLKYDWIFEDFANFVLADK